MKKILLFALVVAVATACNKNQSAVKKLDGSWEITEWTTTDGSLSIDMLDAGFSGTFQFTACKLKSDDWCDVSLSVTYGSATDTDMGYYRITGDGTVLETCDSIGGSISTTDIIDLTKTTLVTQDVDGTTTIDMTLTKN